MRRSAKRGFTIVELLVALGIGAIVLTLVYQIFVTQRRGYAVSEQAAEMQQNARIAADELARLIKNIGNNVDVDGGQEQLLYCGPYELLFNADLDRDDAADRGPWTDTSPVASLFDPSAGAVYTFTTPASPFTTNAELYRLALVLPSPGSRQYELVREKRWGTTADPAETIALNLNRFDESGAGVPLFLYWGDFDNNPDDDLWGDANGDDVLDAGEVAALTPLTGGAGGTLEAHFNSLSPPRDLVPLDQVVRRVEMNVVAEARSPDPQYRANSGYRQVQVRSNVTPRNLWDCPVIVSEHGAATVTAANSMPPTTHRFRVTQHGRAMANQQVIVALDKPAEDTGPDQTTFSTTGLTDSDGWLSVTITWPPCDLLKTILTAHPAGASYTLRATVPATTTDLGFNCLAAPAELAITLEPAGPSKVVLVQSPSPLPLDTCGGTTFFIVQVQDVCGTPVSLAGETLQFQPLNGGADLGSLSPASVTSNSTVAGYTFSVGVTYSAPTAWPLTATRDIGTEHFHVALLASTPGTWLTPDNPTTLPATIQLEPQPRQLANLTVPATANDCPSPDQYGSFQVEDCHQNLVYNLTTHLSPAGTYQAEVVLHNDTLGPDDQGEVVYTGPILSSNGSYGFTYTSPDCTLPATAPGDPPVHRYPDVGVELTESGTLLDVEPPGFVKGTPGTGVPIDLSSCATCEVTVGDITPCTKSTPVTLSGCNFDGRWVKLVASTTGAVRAYFDPPDGQGSPPNVYLHKFAPGQSSVTQNLAIENALSAGDTVSVTAYYLDPTTNAPAWSCSSAPSAVNTKCASLKMYTDPDFQQEFNRSNPSFDPCLATAPSTLYFRLEDCKPGATNVQIEVETVAGGSQHDRADVTLTWDGTYFVSEHDPDPLRAPVRLVASDQTLSNELLTYPPDGRDVLVRATWRDPQDTGDPSAVPPVPPDVCSADATLNAPLPICFPNAITSGGGGNWNGNFRIHWGDVVIRGTADPATAAKHIRKPNSLAAAAAIPLDDSGYLGAQNEDRFFDIYVGRELNGSGGVFNAVPAGQEASLQPFQADGFGNYFQNLSFDEITRMMRFLDYESMRDLARSKKAYWYTLPGSNLIRNPSSGATQDILTVLDRSGPGANPHYDGKFIFIDAYGVANPPAGYEGPTYTGDQIDALPVTGIPPNCLPAFDSGSQIYTEGIVYIAGSLVLRGPGKRQVSVLTPPDFESRYDHNTAALTAADLPLRPDLNATQQPVVLGKNDVKSLINVNGGLYLDGEAEFSGGPTFFGAITAERGFGSGGSGELWYNYDLNVTGAQTTLCVQCCDIQISPAGGVLGVGATLGLIASGGSGALDWAITNPSVLEFFPPLPSPLPAAPITSVTVRGSQLGSATVLVRDENNCVTSARVEVVSPCDYLQPLPPAPLPAGWPQLAVDSSAQLGVRAVQGSALQWQSSNPALAAVNSATGVVAARDGGGVVTVTVRDTVRGCTSTDSVLVQPVCPSLRLVPRIQGNRLFVQVQPPSSVQWSSSNFLVTVTPTGTLGEAEVIGPKGTVSNVTATYRNVLGAATSCTQTLQVITP